MLLILATVLKVSNVRGIGSNWGSTFFRSEKDLARTASASDSLKTCLSALSVDSATLSRSTRGTGVPDIKSSGSGTCSTECRDSATSDAITDSLDEDLEDWGLVKAGMLSYLEERGETQIER